MEKYRKRICAGTARGRSNMRKVWDCFIFNDGKDLDLLEIRLKELYDTVDHFVLCESRFDFRGWRKPLYYRDNASRFKQWSNKIIPMVVDKEVPQQRPFEQTSEWEGRAWANETHQLNILLSALDDAGDLDLILIGHSDEIPDHQIIPTIPIDDIHRRLRLVMFNYNFNLCEHYNSWWACNTGCLRWGQIKKRRYTATDVRDCAGAHQSDIVQYAGWHFSWFGGRQGIVGKEATYPHPVLNFAGRKEKGDVLKYTPGGEELIYIDAIDHLPYCVQEDPIKYVHFFDYRYIESHPEYFGVQIQNPVRFGIN